MPGCTQLPKSEQFIYLGYITFLHTCPGLPTDIQWYIGNPKLHFIPICFAPYCPSHPTVPWDGMDRLELYQSVLFATTCSYSPSHPIAPWEGLGRLGLYQTVPFPTTCPYPWFIPSHCTMGGDGQTGIIPKCPICYALYLLSIPSHCTMGGTGQTRVVAKYPICYHLSLLSNPFHCTMNKKHQTSH